MICKEVLRDKGALLLPRTCPVHGLAGCPTVKPPINKVDASAVAAFVKDLSGKTYGEPNQLSRYQYLAVASAIYPGQGTPFGLMYAALGLAEAGEAQNKVKKIFRDDGVIEFVGGGLDEGGYETYFKPVSEERKAQIVKELGGVLWYVAAVCQELGVDISDVAIANLTELASRSERGTLQGSGDDR